MTTTNDEILEKLKKLGHALGIDLSTDSEKQAAEKAEADAVKQHEKAENKA